MGDLPLAGTYSLNVTLLGTTIPGGLRQVVVEPAAVDADASSAEGSAVGIHYASGAGDGLVAATLYAGQNMQVRVLKACFSRDLLGVVG